MSKSNTVEIIALLWLIAGLLTHSWLKWILLGVALENMIESAVWAYIKHQKAKNE